MIRFNNCRVFFSKAKIWNYCEGPNKHKLSIQVHCTLKVAWFFFFNVPPSVDFHMFIPRALFLWHKSKALCCIRHLVELILIYTSKTIVSHLYVKVREFIISFPEGEFCKREYKGRSGHEVSEPFPQINWLKSMNLRGFGENVKKGRWRKAHLHHLTILLGLTWISSKTPSCWLPCHTLLPQFTHWKEHNSEQKPGVWLISRTIWERREEISRALGKGVDWLQSAQDWIG